GGDPRVTDPLTAVGNSSGAVAVRAGGGRCVRVPRGLLASRHRGRLSGKPRTNRLRLDFASRRRFRRLRVPKPLCASTSVPVFGYSSVSGRAFPPLRRGQGITSRHAVEAQTGLRRLGRRGSLPVFSAAIWWHSVISCWRRW